MKKKLFILLGIFVFLIIPKNVYALSYTASDGNTYEVNSVESFLDYCYFTYPPENDTYNNYIVVNFNNTQYRCMVRGGVFSTWWNSRLGITAGGVSSDNSNSSVVVIVNSSTWQLVNTINISQTNFTASNGIIYSTITTIPASGGYGITFNKNTSIEDILSRYPTGLPYETKNIVFTNFIFDFSLLVPYIIVFVLIFEGVGWLINKKD